MCHVLGEREVHVSRLAAELSIQYMKKRREFHVKPKEEERRLYVVPYSYLFFGGRLGTLAALPTQ